MKLRNKIMAMAIVAVAGVNVYLANDIRVQRNELSLQNLENIAEADEDGECLGSFVRRWVESDTYGITKCAEYTNAIVYNRCEGRDMVRCVITSDEGDNCPAYGNGPHKSWVGPKR